MSLGKQERPGSSTHGLVEPPGLRAVSRSPSGYALLVRLGRAREVVETCPRSELWSELVTQVRSLTGAAAVSVATVAEDEIAATAAGDSAAPNVPPGRRSRAHRAGGAGCYEVKATSGEVDLSDGGTGTTIVNVPIDLGDKRLGTVTMLGAPWQSFTSVDSEAARQLISAAVLRLVPADAAGARPEAELEPAHRRGPPAELSVSETLVRRAFELSPVALAVLDASADRPGRIVQANAQLAALLGYSRPHELTGQAAQDYVHPDDLRFLREQVHVHEQDQERGSAANGDGDPPIRLKTRHGVYVAARVRCAHGPHGDVAAGGGPGSAPAVLCHVSFVQERDAPAQALPEGDRLFEVTFDKCPVGMMLVTMAPERRGRVCLANPELAKMLHRTDDELTDQPLESFMPAQDAQATLAVLDDVADTGADSARAERQCVRADGATLHCWISAIVIDDTTPGGPFVLCHVVDLTAQRGQQRALERMALTDSLTQLPNRSLFTARVDQALAGIEPGSRVALMVLDLDRFKNVNDSMGHHFGDLLLMEVAARLGALDRPGASVARQGGDEFTVLVQGVADDYEITSLAEELLVLLTGDYQIGDGQIVSTSASIGVSIADSSAHTREQLMREADLALYAAKGAGRNRFVLCDEELLAAASRREDSEQRLRRALHTDGLRVLLQPIVSLDTGRVLALEALVRVYDPEIGTMEADQIIKVAEDSGLIAELDRRVMDESVRLVTVDPRLAEDPSVRVNINVSARTLEQPGLVRHFAEVLAKHGVPGDRVAIELTESSLLGDDPAIRQAVVSMRRLGAHIGIDDFGTGYSALAYLERFGLDFLKVDQAFVASLGREYQRSRATVAAIITLAHAHGLQVTAEGVETPTQRDMLRDLGCEAGQGWLFGAATASDAVECEMPAKPRAAR